jgi:hypothetical protein
LDPSEKTALIMVDDCRIHPHEATQIRETLIAGLPVTRFDHRN